MGVVPARQFLASEPISRARGRIAPGGSDDQRPSRRCVWADRPGRRGAHPVAPRPAIRSRGRRYKDDRDETRQGHRQADTGGSGRNDDARRLSPASAMTVGGAHDAAAIRVAAPAKINLYLHVVGRRADGYHELDSLVAFADIADFVTARPAADLSLAIDGPFAAALGGAPADNLVLQAARLLASHCGVTAGAALRLTKTLPIATAIAGGSADAAAAFRALQSLWRLQTSGS